MKRICLFFSLVALFTLNGNAQKGTTNYGLKIGPNLNWVSSSSDSGENAGAKLGFCLGGFVDHYFSDYMALSLGLNFQVTSLSYQFIDNRFVENFLVPSNVSVNRKFKGSYFEVPVKVKVKTEIMDSWKVYADAGVGVGVNLSARGKDSYEFYGVSYTDTRYVNYLSEYRLLQAALKFGVGAEYEVSSNLNVFAQLTYHHALSNTFTKRLQDLTGSNLKLRFIGLEMGILF